MVAPLAKRPCQMGSKYTCQTCHMAKKCQKMHQIGGKSPNRHQVWPKRIVFLMFWPKAVILRGCNIAQFRKQQPVQNSAPNVRRMPEKPLKPPLIHQNDHRRRKKGKVPFLEFDFDHIKGQHGRILEASGFTPGAGVTYGMDLVLDGTSGAPHPDTHQKATARGGGGV